MKYIVSALVELVGPVKTSSDVVVTNWVPKANFSRFLKGCNATKSEKLSKFLS